jgi:cyclophilin family peptidyl-prolyl cis-trans isomerase
MPQISPDGESIVFVHLVKDSWQIYVAPIPLDVKTNPITLEDASRVSADESAQYILPYWSPDGTELLVTKNNSGEAVQTALLDASGIEDMEVRGLPGSIGFGWTSDGAGLHVGLENKDGALNLATIDVATLTPTFVDSSLAFVVAAWSPDDSELMAIDPLAGAAWLLDSDATGLRRSVDAEQLPIRMAWRPKEYGDPVPTPSVDDGDFRMLGPGDDPAPPVGALDTDLNYSAMIFTDSGEIVLELFDNLAPMTVENFVNLARIGFYDGMDFHRVVPGVLSQTGDPPGDRNDGPGYTFNDEFTRELLHDTAGIVSMANVSSNTNGRQFLITHDAANWLDAYDAGVAKNCADDAVLCHPIFGRVIAGMEIVTSMEERDPDVVTTPGVTILSVKINEN